MSKSKANSGGIKENLIPMLRSWAAQKKRVMTGMIVFPDGGIHEDGWPSSSSTMLPFNGGNGGNPPGTHNQRFDEVYSGSGLVIWRIYTRAPPEIREILFAHFVVAGGVRKKARILDISIPSYWNMLDRAYYYLAGAIPQIHAQGGRKVSRRG